MIYAVLIIPLVLTILIMFADESDYKDTYFHYKNGLYMRYDHDGWFVGYYKKNNKGKYEKITSNDELDKYC